MDGVEQAMFAEGKLALCGGGSFDGDNWMKRLE